MRANIVKVLIFTIISGILTTVVVTSLLDVNLKPANGYTADFTNASGLEAGDTVRIAGVEVGKVGAVTLGPGHAYAKVSFSVDDGHPLTTTTAATIHFADLLGQRYLALLPGRAGGRPLRSGATIPLRRTTPALDLTAVFDGFAPLFSALAPGQVNELAGSIIEVLQGESGTIAGLVQQTAVITNNLADRQQVINGVLNNLAALLTSVGGHDAQLGQLITGFDTLVKGLAAGRSQLAGTIDGISALNHQVAGLLGQSQPALDQDIASLQQSTGTIATDQTQLDQALDGLPGLVSTLTKVQSSGSYLNVYICDLAINITGDLNVSLIPGLPAPQYGDPVKLPSGAIGNQSEHSATCA